MRCVLHDFTQVHVSMRRASALHASSRKYASFTRLVGQRDFTQVCVVLLHVYVFALFARLDRSRLSLSSTSVREEEAVAKGMHAITACTFEVSDNVREHDETSGTKRRLEMPAT